jgi:hypothetical protein
VRWSGDEIVRYEIGNFYKFADKLHPQSSIIAKYPQFGFIFILKLDFFFLFFLSLKVALFAQN